MRKEKSLTIHQLAFYLGCECMVNGKRGKLTKIDTQHLPSVSFPHSNGSSSRQFVTPEQIKLILIPLSEIGSEELTPIARKYEYDEKYIQRFVDISPLEDIGTDDDFVCHKEDFRTAVCILNELRALGYDCDDLIPQELAIDKTKLK